MTDPQLTEEDIFQVARRIDSADERRVYLDQSCGENLTLREQVEALLAAHDASGSFLESPATGILDNIPSLDQPLAEQPGTQIGPYKLIEQIGEGGMGVVYLAEQTEPVQRLVALKIIKLGMNTRQVIGRFEAERQALAIMDHPNIAKVLDAGMTDTGRPYFVMELVKGVPITVYCDEHHLTPHERLELFLPVCQAVQHAHQKGIIHRDIKPSNVMVAHYDDRAVPKVIDFGVAKAIEQRPTEKTVFTELGQVVGTVEYMSPEQARLNQLDVDTRSDVYSLGVLLYELLTGETPFDGERLRNAAFDELLRIIREEEPPKPSLRLSTSASLPSIAANRHIEPQKLNSLLHGDLDWIVMKALEKDRTRRYETANGFANDIQRYLDDKPVTASPPSTAYRFKKFVRRNKAAIATGSVLAAALLAGLAGTTWQAIRATRAEQVAQANLQDAVEAQERAGENFRRARQAVDEYFTLVSESTLLDEEGMQPLRKQLLESAQRYYEEFSQQQTDDPELLAELAATHFRIAMTQFAMESTDWVQPFHTSLDILERLLREGADASLRAVYTSGAFKYHGFYDVPNAHADEALAAFERGVKVLGKLAAAHPDIFGFQHDLAACHLMAGETLMIKSQHTPAITELHHARQIWENLLQTDGAVPEYGGRLGDVYRSLKYALKAAGRREEFQQISRDGIATLRAAYGNDHLQVAFLLRLDPSQDQAEKKTENLREAIAIFERTLSQDGNSPRSLPEIRYTLSLARSRLGVQLQNTGRANEAEQEFLKAIQLCDVLVDQNPTSRQFRHILASTCRYLGDLYGVQGRVDEALKVYFREQKLLELLLEEEPSNIDYLNRISQVFMNIGGLYRGSGQLAEAETLFAEVETLYRAAILDFDQRIVANPEEPAYRFGLGTALANLAGALQAEKRLPEAEEAYRRALDVYQKAATDFPDVSKFQWDLYHTLRSQGFRFWEMGETDLAVEPFTVAQAIIEKMAADFPNVPKYRLWLAENLADMANLAGARGRQEESEQLYRDAMEVYEHLATEHPENSEYEERRLQSLRMLANSLVRQGKTIERSEDIEQAFQHAIDGFAQLTADFPDEEVYRAHLGDTLWELSGFLEATKRIPEAEAAYRRALDVFQKAAVDFPSVPFERRRVSIGYWNLGLLFERTNRIAEAEQFFRDALEVGKALSADFPEDKDYHAGVIQIYLDLSRCLRQQEKFAEAEQIIRDWIQSFDQLIAANPEEPTYQANLGDALRELAGMLDTTKRISEAEAAYRRALDVYQKATTDPHTRVSVSSTYWNLGALCEHTNRIAEAEQFYREALEVDKPLSADFPERKDFRDRVTRGYDMLSRCLRQQGKLAEAEAATRRAESLRAKVLIEEITQTPDLTYVSYRVRIGTPGEYRLYLRWDGHDGNSDSVYVHLVELADGPGGSVADLYGYEIPSFFGDADFATLPEWQGSAGFEVQPVNVKGDPAVWTIAAPGDYTIRFVMREDGAALDALVLQLSSQPEPEGEGPAESATAGEKTYLESAGRVVVEAEHFADRGAPGTANWRVVPDEDPGDPVHLNYRGTGYLQALPDSTAENPAEVVKNRGYVKVHTGRWDEALAHFAEAKQLRPDDVMTWYFQAAASLALDDTEGFRQICAGMLEQFGQTENSETAHWIAWTCALAPEALSDLAAAVQLAEQAVSTKTSSDSNRNTLGAILYRAGQFEAAIDEFDQLAATWDEQNMPTRTSPAYTWFFLAMAHHRQGNADEAREYLEQATERAEQEIEDDASWNRKLTLELLRREATELLSQEDLQPDNSESEKSDSKPPAEKDGKPDE